MCGRFAASASTEEIVESFAVDEVVDAVQPSFNLAPTDLVPVVLQRTNRESAAQSRILATMRWGLVPSWAKDARGGARLINARAETVATKPSFRKAFAARRCLIPADGFYEWETLPAAGARKPVKQPWFIRRVDGERMAMAGIYEFWKDPGMPEAPWLMTCSIITTEAEDALGTLHDRMPMVVRRTNWDAWLDQAEADPLHAQTLLDVESGPQLQTLRVSRAVNSVRNDGPELVAPQG